jgi:hypothetical protein
MYCEKCGIKLLTDSKYCPNCGQEIITKRPVNKDQDQEAKNKELKRAK